MTQKSILTSQSILNRAKYLNDRCFEDNPIYFSPKIKFPKSKFPRFLVFICMYVRIRRVSKFRNGAGVEYGDVCCHKRLSNVNYLTSSRIYANFYTDFYYFISRHESQRNF